jgi:HTH-type transcriptional regulator/antitoxin HigA
MIMIINKRQHSVTKAQIKRLEKTLALSKGKRDEMDKRIFDSMIAGIRSQISELKDQVKEYERMQSAKAISYSLDSLPNVLIQARVARGLTQEQLAKKIKVDARQIQRYEKTNYSSVSLERVIDILKALDINLKGRIAL